MAAWKMAASYPPDGGILEWTEETIERLDREARERFVVVG